MPQESKYNLGINNLVFNLAYYTCKAFLILRYNVHIEGEENIPKNGSAIILPKHQHEFDIPLTAMLIKSVGRKAYFVMKNTLNTPLLDYILRKCGGVPIDRDNIRNSIQEFKYLKKKVSDGELLVVYPEGRKSEGKMSGGRLGVFQMWRDYLLIPVGIEYKGRDVYVKAGTAIEAKGMKAEELSEIVMGEIARLSGF